MTITKNKKTKPAKKNNFYRLIVLTGLMFLIVFNVNSQSISNLITGTEKTIFIDKKQIYLPYKKISSVTLNLDLFTKHNQDIGDKIIIDLFDNQSYVTTIDRINTDINGTLTIRARLDDYPLGYLLISYTDNNVLGTVSIPEKNEIYSIKSFAKTGKSILKLIDVEKMDVLEGAPSLIPDIDIERIITSQKPKSKDSKDPANIDIMIVYTPFAFSWANTYEGSINNTIAQAMAKAQLALDNSNTNITLTLVHSAMVDYTDSGDSYTDLNRLTLWGDDYMDQVQDWRQIYGADLVALFSNFSDAGGVAWLLPFKTGGLEIGFSVTRIQQASNTYTLIHEMGHNMGASHHKLQNIEPGPTEWSDWPENTWSAGWRWTGTDENRYCSVMTYEGGEYFDDGLNHVQVPYFSNPNITYQGVATGHAADGDNAGTISEVKHAIADYTESVAGYPTVSTSSVVSITGLSAISGGNVTSEGDSPIIAKGLVWSRYRNYNWLTINLNQGLTNEGAGTGSFVSNITDLHPNTTYYVRAYATNSQGTRYGELRSFTTEQIFEGGNGTEEFPYLIATAEQLNTVRYCNKDTYFKQIADIDLGISPWNQGEGWLPIGSKEKPCLASYDGNNFTINGLYINRPESSCIGLFGYKKISVKDLTLNNVYIVAKDTIGGLAGYNDAKIINCSVSGQVNGNNYVGGLIGWHQSVLIQNSSSACNVTGNEKVGGLIGFKTSTSVIDACYSLGSISGSKYVGGLIGFLSGGTLSKCYSYANVTASLESVGGLIGYSTNHSIIKECFTNGEITTSGNYAGGLIGFTMYTTIENSFNHSSVSGENRIGGLVGYAVVSTVINNCYSKGAVFSNGTSYVGGLVGQMIMATATNSFWDTETSKQATSGCGTGLVTSQMQKKSIYTNATWDFKGAGVNDIWNIGNSRNNGYPYLNWQFPDDLPDNPPVITTVSISNITISEALGTGNIIELGDTNPIQHGFCWNTTGEPTVDDNKVENGLVSTTGNFTASMAGLDEGTLYYARAFASNTKGTSYGETFSFRTLPTSPLSICEALDNCDFVFTSGGNGEWFGQTVVSNDGVDAAQSSPISNNQQTWLESSIQGPGTIKFYWKVSSEEKFDKLAFLINDVEQLSSSGSTDWEQVEFTIEEEAEVPIKWIYSKDISNSVGLDAGWVDQFEFTPIVYTTPTVLTIETTNITQGTAQSVGEVTDDGGRPVTARGVVWSTVENPTISENEGVTTNGSGLGEFISYISGLEPNTTYYVRAYATNIKGTAYGEQKSFTTLSSTVPIAPEGLGTEDYPYLIASLNNLIWLSNNELEWNKHYLQIANIDASETSGLNGGQGWLPIGNGENGFSGKYNGGDYSIDGLYINRSENYQGLFGYVYGDFANKAKLENIKLINASFTGSWYVGALAGSVAHCNIINCFVSANVNGTASTGGLIGGTSSSNINSSYSIGSVTGSFVVGGLIGNNNYSKVMNSFSLSSVSGDDRVGGFIGNNISSDIELLNCYSAGAVTGTESTGGFIGLNTNAPVINCYWDTQTSTQTTSSAGFGRTTAEMTHPYAVSTYEDWDFVIRWAEDTDFSVNNGYPYLRMYKSPELSTKPFTDITQISVKTGGIISNDGGAEVIEKGVVWLQRDNTDVIPTIESNHGITNEGAGSDDFTSEMTSLNAGYNYIVRAYSTNPIGTSYGNTLQLKVNTVDYYISHLSPSGAIEGNMTQYVQDGESSSQVTAVPNEGFFFDSWSDGVTDNPRNDINVTSNIMVYPIFEVIRFTITATSGDNGNISPSGQVQCNYNSSQTFNFYPNVHYVIGNVMVDDESIGPVNEYSFENVTSNHTIHVDFIKRDYLVNISVNDLEGFVLVNGTPYTGEMYLEALSEVTIEAVPSDGWQFKQWDGDIVSNNAVQNFTLESSMHLSATFELKTYIITSSAEPNGTIVPSGVISVYHGQDQQFSISPNTNYHISDVLVDGESTGNVSGSFFLYDVDSNHTITAVFDVNVHSLNLFANPDNIGAVLSGADIHDAGEIVSISATVVEGYNFVGWSGSDLALLANPNSLTTSLTMPDRDVTFTANYETVSHILFTINPEEGGVVTGAGTYSYGTYATISVTPNEGFNFVSISDNDDSEWFWWMTEYTFFVEKDRNLVANFEKQSFSIYAEPNIGVWGEVSGARWYLYGSTAELIATPYTGYYFINWTEDGNEVSTSPTYTFTVVGTRNNLIANFSIQTFTISANANPAEGGIISGAGNYNYNSMVELFATPATNYDFVNWTENGTEISTNQAYAFVAEADRNMLANFVKQTVSITATPNPVSGGTIFGTGNYDYNSSVELVATAATGYDFVNWTENGTEISTNQTYSFTAQADRNLIANFAIQTFTISASANPAEGGTVTGARNYDYNTPVELMATPNTGYSFVNWTEDGTEVSTNQTYSITAQADRTFIANFSIINTINYISDGNNKLNVFPNPAKDVLTIQIIDNKELNNRLLIFLINSAGKTIQLDYKNNSEGMFEISVADVLSGLYLIDVMINDKSIGKGRVIIIK